MQLQMHPNPISWEEYLLDTEISELICQKRTNQNMTDYANIENIYQSHIGSVLCLDEIKTIENYNRLMLSNISYDITLKSSEFYESYCVRDGVIDAELQCFRYVWNKMREDLMSQTFNRQKYQYDICDFLLIGNASESADKIQSLHNRKDQILSDNNIKSAKRRRLVTEIDKEISLLIGDTISNNPTINDLSRFYDYDLTEYCVRDFKNIVSIHRLLGILSNTPEQKNRFVGAGLDMNRSKGLQRQLKIMLGTDSSIIV